MSRDATPDALLSELERLSDRAVPGTERCELGSWWLRAGLGATGRANSTWAPGAPNGSVSAAVDAVEAWYRQRRLVPRFQMFDHGETELSAELDRRGWPATIDTWVMTAPIPAVMAGVRVSASADRSVDVTPRSTPSFAALLADPRRLAEVTATEQPFRVATVRDGDELLGGGMTTIDGRWAAVGAMNTRPDARRRGVASAVAAALAAAAAELGADTMWLQVQSDNDGAIALYRRLGFEAVHRYGYRIAPVP